MSCPKGHPAEFYAVCRSGKEWCRICHRDAGKLYRERRQKFGGSYRDLFCKNGHRRTLENTRYAAGSRTCLVCERAKRKRLSGRYALVSETMLDVVLGHVGQRPRSPARIYAAVLDDWGRVCERQIFRALAELVRRGSIMRIGANASGRVTATAEESGYVLAPRRASRQYSVQAVRSPDASGLL